LPSFLGLVRVARRCSQRYCGSTSEGAPRSSSRDGEASPVGTAELFALNRRSPRRREPRPPTPRARPRPPTPRPRLLFEVVPAPREIDPFDLQVAGVPSPVPAIAGPFVEEPDLHCLLVPRRVLKQLVLPSSSQIVAKGRGDGWKNIDDAFGLRRRDDKFSSSRRSKTSREKPDCSHVAFGTAYNLPLAPSSEALTFNCFPDGTSFHCIDRPSDRVGCTRTK
jgi:hypothetical protein